MPRSTVRMALAGAVCAALVLLLAAPAGAFVGTQITSPANGTYLMGEAGEHLTVLGTSSYSEVDVRCYSSPEGYSSMASKVPVTGGKFEVSVSLLEFGARVCQVRAVPTGTSHKNLGPGESSEEAAAFQGPIVYPSKFTTTPSGGPLNALSAYFAGAVVPTASMFFEPAGDYAVEGDLFSASAHTSEYGLYGDGALKSASYSEEKTLEHSEIVIDGTPAYTVAALATIEGTPITGVPKMTVSRTFDPTTHQFTVQEEDPIFTCAPEPDVYPATTTSCKSATSAGVTLVRSLHGTNEDHLAWVTDVLRSTDGHAHSALLRYYEEFSKAGTGAYELPGQASFAPTEKAGETRSLGSGRGFLLYKSDAATPEAGDGVHPFAAIAWDAAPSSPALVLTKSEPGTGNQATIELPYSLAVPAGGSSQVLRSAYAQGFTQAEVTSLAESAVASYAPTVAITAPANGAVVSTPAVTVTGTAADGVAVSSVNVNGTAATLAPNGTWSASVPLKPGPNTLTATATDQSGITASASVGVTYNPPAPPPAKAFVSSLSGRNGSLSFAVACVGSAGQSCRVEVVATTTEKLRHGRVSALTARTRKVIVAKTTLTLSAGQHVTVTTTLNRAGRALLARFRRLPVRVTAVLTGPAGRTAVLTAKVTVTPKPRHKRHHR